MHLLKFFEISILNLTDNFHPLLKDDNYIISKIGIQALAEFLNGNHYHNEHTFPYNFSLLQSSLWDLFYLSSGRQTLQIDLL